MERYWPLDKLQTAANLGRRSGIQERLNKMQIVSDSCAKIRNLGFKASMHVSMYGERFEIVSDPFDEAGGVAVRGPAEPIPRFERCDFP